MRCLIVSRRIDRIIITLPTTRKVLDNIEVITGKTTEKQNATSAYFLRTKLLLYLGSHAYYRGHA